MDGVITLTMVAARNETAGGQLAGQTVAKHPDPGTLNSICNIKKSRSLTFRSKDIQHSQCVKSGLPAIGLWPGTA